MRGFPSNLGKGFASRHVHRLGLASFNIHGSWMELNPSAWIDRTLLSGEEHDPLVYRTIMEGMAQGGIFIDVGANIGVFTLAAARIPGAVVYAFEPSPRELRRLYRNLALNDVHNVIVFPLALSATTSQLELSICSEANPGGNTLISGERDSIEKTVLCRCEPLDTLLPHDVAEQVKVVKIDVEGFEMEALKGMSRLMDKMRQAVFVVEVTRTFLGNAGSSAEEMYAFFADRGFRPTVGLQDFDQWNEKFVR